MESLFSNVDFKKLKGDINAQTRIVIHNIYLFLNELKSDPEKISQLNFNRTRENVAFICGVSRATVDRIKTEISQYGSPANPRESFKKATTITNIDNIDISLLKRTISTMYDNGEYPTVAKIRAKCSEFMPYLKCGQTSMRKILKNIGYKFKKNKDGQKSLDGTDIVYNEVSPASIPPPKKKRKLSASEVEPVSNFGEIDKEIDVVALVEVVISDDSNDGQTADKPTNTPDPYVNPVVETVKKKQKPKYPKKLQNSMEKSEVTENAAENTAEADNCEMMETDGPNSMNIMY